MMVTRRDAVRALALTALAACRRGKASAAPTDTLVERLRDVETSAGGRLGVYIFDTQSRSGFGYRMDERFAHCSSFKMSLAAMILRGIDRGEVNTAEVLRWAREDLMPVSPVTEEHLATGLTAEALARATLVTSDNTAANVLMRRFGGPSAVTAFWRAIGDGVSRLDRYEPELNITPAGTELDTTTPHAIALSTARLLYGDALQPRSRETLARWMADVRTGTQRIRAGFPSPWISGDKTGTGIGPDKHTYVDIAYGAPPGRAPLIASAFFEPRKLVEPMDPVALGALASVGRVCRDALVIFDA